MAFEIGITFAVFSVVVFFFSLTYFIRKSKGIFYLIVLRVMAALFMFLSYSVFVAPVTTTTQPYTMNIVINSTTNTTGQAHYPMTNTTTTLSQGAQNAIGYTTLAWIMLVLGSLGVELIWELA